MSTCTTITINNEIDFLGTISDLYAHTYEFFKKINDEPVIKEVEEHKWLTAGLTALVAVAVVGAIAVAAFCGAVSGAVAATPLGVGGQMAVNGVIGGVQSALTGGSAVDVAEGFAIGMFCGWLGGNGFVNGWPRQGYINRNLVWSLFHPFKTLAREGIKAIQAGVTRSAAFNIFYSGLKKYLADKLEDLYESIVD